MFQMDLSKTSPSSSSPTGIATMTTSSGKSQRQARKPFIKPNGTWVVERVNSVTGIPELELIRRK